MGQQCDSLPTLNKTIAFAFPLRDFTAPGTALDVDVNGQRQPSVVQALPFHSPESIFMP